MMLTVRLDVVHAVNVTDRGNISHEFVMPTTTSRNKRANAAIDEFEKLGYHADRGTVLVMGVKTCEAEYQIELDKFLTLAERTR